MQDNTIYPEHPVWGTALAVLDGEPVWPQCGGAPDDDEDGPEIDLENPESGKPGGGRDVLDDDPDEDDEPATEDEPEDEPEKPADKKKSEQKAGRTEADFEKLEKALASERTLRRKHGAALAEYKKKEREAQVEGDDETAEKIRKATEAAEARFKPIAVHAAAKAALLERNFQRPTDTRIKKMVAKLDLDDIEIDDDGDVIGLDTQIEQLAEDFPELFTAPAATAPEPTKPKAPRLNTANKPPATPTYGSTGERIAARVLGGQK